jgi:nucleoside phosphorylase
MAPKRAESAQKSFAYSILEPISVHRDGVHLVTSDTPIHSTIERKELSKNFDLVDMEGYAIAWFSQETNTPLRMHKVISDMCNSLTSQEIRKILPSLSEKISKLAQNMARSESHPNL